MHEFHDWIGREICRPDLLTLRLIAEWNATLAPHVFAGEGLPGLHWALAPATPKVHDLGPDGAERKGLFLPPIPLPRRMWAGGALDSMAMLVPGAAIERRSIISDIKWREGRSGSLCLVSLTHEIVCAGRLCLRERQDLVFRAAGQATSPAPAPPRAADLVDRVELTPTLLFRFSALTFNGHRIHYDRPYAEGVEGYPGLVAHGPLQAVLLLNQAATLLKAVPRRFEYRCVAPLIAEQTCEVATLRQSEGATGWIRDSRGIITCEAQAWP